MSFQAYLDDIQTKTGLDAAGFRALAAQKGFTKNGILTPETKAAAVIAWLKADYDLGHGHSMAIFALLKGKKKEGDA
jgi:Domain of unknown function (DUF4287)